MTRDVAHHLADASLRLGFLIGFGVWWFTRRPLFSILMAMALPIVVLAWIVATAEPDQQRVAARPDSANTALPGHVSTPAQQEWEAKQIAVKRYPLLGIAGTPFNKKYTELYTKRRLDQPTYFANPEWPLLLADETSRWFLNHR
jgi:hypothetical protein